MKWYNRFAEVLKKINVNNTEWILESFDESLKNKNETKKGEMNALKGLNFAGIKFHAIQYNPGYYIQQKHFFWLSSAKLKHQEKNKIFGF